VPAAVHHALLDADSRVLTSTDTFGTASLTKESPPYPSPLRLPRVELWNGFNDPFRVIPPSVRTLTPKLRDAKNVQTPGIDMSVDAARRSACATLGVGDAFLGLGHRAQLRIFQ
jgi:hypothetical protein